MNEFRTEDKNIKWFENSKTLTIVIMVILIAILVYAGYRDIVRLYDNHIEEVESKLNDTVDNIDNVMDMSVKHLELFNQVFLEDYGYSEAEMSLIINDLIKVTDNNFYYETSQYEEQSSTSGLGDVTLFSEAQKQVLFDSIRLTPYFAIAKNNLIDSQWIYFVSKESFITLYPYVSHEDYIFTKETMSKDFYKLTLPEFNPDKEIIATDVYLDEVGAGQMITITYPVYKRGDYLGSLSIDFTLDSITELLDKNTFKNIDVLLINNYDNILARNNFPKENSLLDYLENRNMTLDKFSNAKYNKNLVRVGKNLVISKSSNIFPWHLVAVENVSLIYIEIAKEQVILGLLIIVLIVTVVLYSKKMKVNLEIYNNQLKFEQIINQTVQLTAILDIKGNILFINKTAASMIDIPIDKLIGKPFYDTPWWNWSSELMLFIEEAVVKANEGEHIKKDVIHIDADGQEQHIEFTMNAIYNKKGKIEYLAANGKNITDRILLKESMDKLVKLDMLTNLGNRRAILDKINIEVSRVNRTDSTFSILLCDIDFFKLVNDTYGHNVGDEVLVALANHMLEHVRSHDELGRWGGEEFIFVLPDTHYLEAIELGNRICNSVRTLKIDAMNQKAFNSITLTIGVTEYNPKYEINTIIKQADDALYYAKENGRDQVMGFFDIP